MFGNNSKVTNMDLGGFDHVQNFEDIANPVKTSEPFQSLEQVRAYFTTSGGIVSPDTQDIQIYNAFEHLQDALLLLEYPMYLEEDFYLQCVRERLNSSFKMLNSWLYEYKGQPMTQVYNAEDLLEKVALLQKEFDRIARTQYYCHPAEHYYMVAVGSACVFCTFGFNAAFCGFRDNSSWREDSIKELITLGEW